MGPPRPAAASVSPVRADLGPSATRRESWPFTATQDAIARAERPGGPMTLGVGLELDGRLDAGLLSHALALVLAARPELCARRAPMNPWTRWPRWEVDGVPDPSAVLRVVRNRTGTPTDRCWPALLADPLPLDGSSVIRLRLVQGRSADELLVVAHQAAVDPHGVLTFLQELAARYRELAAHGDDVVVLGTVDGPDGRHPRVTAGGAPDARAARGFGPDGAAERWCRKAGPLGPLLAPAPARIASYRPTSNGGWVERSGHGVTRVSVDRGLTDSLHDVARSLDVRFAAILAAAVHLTVESWNRRRSQPVDHIAVSVPVGSATGEERPLLCRTATTVGMRCDPAAVAVGIESQLRAGGTDAVDGPGRKARRSAPPVLPLHARRALPVLGSAVTADRGLATTRLEHLGTVAAPSLDFGAVGCRRLDLSVPVRMPQGVSFGTVELGHELNIALRWCDAMLGPESAAELAALSVDQLRRFA